MKMNNEIKRMMLKRKTSMKKKSPAKGLEDSSIRKYEQKEVERLAYLNE